MPSTSQINPDIANSNILFFKYHSTISLWYEIETQYYRLYLYTLSKEHKHLGMCI